MYNGRYFPITNFKGGYCGNIAPAALRPDQALDLDNIVIAVGGWGFRTRRGNSKYNSSVFQSGSEWQGLGYFAKFSGSNYVVGTINGKFGTNATSGGTSFTDSTGSITITAGRDNQWDFATFNDTLIAFGGSVTSPDAPFKWTGSGNAAALGGSPPSALGCFTANNRVFAYRTAAAPSTIYWSIIGSAEDWTGSGSGSAVVGSLSDNQAITGAQILSTNYVIVFKATSTYQMAINSSPFPVYTLFDKVGCVGKHASINVDGRVYWINQRLRMCSTDGEKYEEYPSDADDIWNTLAPTRAPYIHAVRQKGVDYDWIVWTAYQSGTENSSFAIIWDLINKCWLRCSTGYNMNVSTTDLTGAVYFGGRTGFIYLPDQSAIYADASETSPGTITGYWRSGWFNGTDIEKITQPNELGVLYKIKASGSFTVDAGFDFIADSMTQATITQTATSSETRAFKYVRITGRGNFFNFKVQHSSSTIDTAIDQIYLRGKIYGQKVMTNR